MYHLGKVLKVFKSNEKDILGADNTVQVMAEMWDENMFTFMVHPMLNEHIKVNDIVLVEYDFVGGNRQPRQTAVKVLRGKVGEESWKKMAVYFDQLRRKQTQSSGNPLALDLALPQDNMVR